MPRSFRKAFLDEVLRTRVDVVVRFTAAAPPWRRLSQLYDAPHSR